MVLTNLKLQHLRSFSRPSGLLPSFRDWLFPLWQARSLLHQRSVYSISPTAYSRWFPIYCCRFSSIDFLQIYCFSSHEINPKPEIGLFVSASQDVIFPTNARIIARLTHSPTIRTDIVVTLSNISVSVRTQKLVHSWGTSYHF